MAGIGSWISKNPFIFIIAIVALVGVAYLASGAGLTVVSPLDTYYAPKYASIKCELTGGITASEHPQFVNVKDITGLINVAQSAKFNCAYVGGCQIRSVSYTCGFPAQKAGYKIYRNGIAIKEVSGIESYDPSILKFYKGDNIEVRTRCYFTPFYLAPTSSSIDLVGNQAKLYLYDPTGTLKSGELTNSDGCTLTSGGGYTKTQLQKTNNNTLTMAQLSLGQTVGLISSWDTVPLGGSLVTYSGVQAVCRNKDGIYEIDHNAIVSGQEYHTIGNALKKSYNTCCDNTGCIAPNVCDSASSATHIATFACVASSPVCTYGTCSFSAAACGDPVQYTGTYPNIKKLTTSCNSNTKCCDRTETAVKCSPAYCGSISTASTTYVCVETVGCQAVTTKTTCPNGMCCPTVSGSPYYEQGCSSGQTCCVASGTKYVGTCKTSCDATTVCTNKCASGQTQKPFPDCSCLGGTTNQTCVEKIDARVCGSLDFACPIDKFFGKIGCAIDSAIQSLATGFLVFGGIALLILAVFLFSRKKGGKR